jgi:protein SCO1
MKVDLTPPALRSTTSVLLTLLITATLVASCSQPATLNGVVRSDPLDVSGVALLDVTDPALRGSLPLGADGRVTLVAPDRGVLLVYFGFLNCPDICPTTLADVRSALGQLDATAIERIELAFITVDPARDGPTELAAYLRHFSPRFHALREPGAPLDSALDAFLASARITEADDGTIDVSHTAVLYAVDDRGLVLVEWPFGTSARALADDLRVLLDRTGTSPA